MGPTGSDATAETNSANHTSSDIDTNSITTHDNVGTASYTAEEGQGSWWSRVAG